MLVIITSFFSAVQVGCKKDKNTRGCENIPQSNSLHGWNGVMDSNDNNALSFVELNPGNQTEILFAVDNPSPSSRRFYKKDLITGQVTKVFTGSVFGNPDWGKNGWILFGLNNGTIWKVKGNGDSVEQLSQLSGSYQPVWGFSDTTVIRHRVGLGRKQESTLNGVDLKSYEIYANPPIELLSDSLIGFIEYNKVYILNANTGKRELIHDLGKDVLGSSALTLIEKEVFYSSSDGVYATDIISHKVRRIRSTCNSTRYSHLCYSAVLDKVFVSIGVYSDFNQTTNTFKIKGEIRQMDIYGGDEIRVPISIP